MVKKYVMVRMPKEADDEFKRKRELMERRVKSWTGKETKIPMANVYRLVAKSTSEIHEKNIIRLVKKRKVKKGWY